MATKKQLTNRFQSDIDMCNNQIKNYTAEYWGDKPEHTGLPTDNLFEGRHIHLVKDYIIYVPDPENPGQMIPYTYEAGADCILHIDSAGDTHWQKLLTTEESSTIAEEVIQLWREKTGIIRVYATWADMNATIVTPTDQEWDMDIAIVEVDEKKNGDRTMYYGVGIRDLDKTTRVIRWDFIAVLENANRTNRKTTFDDGCVSYLSNETGDNGACMTFENTDGIVSGVGVDKNAGTRAQMYAVDKTSKVGTRINVTKDKIYYTKGKNDSAVSDDEEIATMKDVKVYASKCWGTKNTHAELASITGMDIADYVYVLHDEDQLAKRSGETIAPSTRYYYDGTNWIYSCDIGNTSVRLLGDVPGAPAGTQFNLPYYFYTVENADDIDAHVKSVSLDNRRNFNDFSLKIKGAHVVDTDPSKIKAGLYNKTLADAKLNIDSTMVMTGLTTRNRKANVWEINTPRRKLDNSGSTDQPFFNLEQMDYAGDKAGLYTKAMADAKLDILTGAPDGKAYKLPYYFETVPDASKIRVKSHTITLDNKKEVDTTSYFIDVVGATQTVAGLMTATDKTKLDNLGVTTDETSTTNPFSAKYTMDKIREYGADFAGNVATHDKLKELVNKPGITPVVKLDFNDYAIVDDDSAIAGHEKECWRYRCVNPIYLGTAEFEKAWAAECRVSNVPFTTDQWSTINSKIYNSDATGTSAIVGGINVQDLMKKLPEEPYSHTQYKFPFHIEDPVQNQSNITAKFHTLVLNDGVTRNSYDVTIPSADIANDKAGLYTKAMADKKVDRTVKDAQNASNTIDNQFGQNGCVMQTYLNDNKTVISFNTASENGPDGILGQVYAKDYTTGQGMRINFTKTGAYYGVGSSTPTDTAHEIAVKGDLTPKMDKLPLETYSHTEYKFPFHIEAPVQNQTNITAKFHTLVLNDGVTRNQYDITIPAADITNDKAGLYTKVLADGKFDVPIGTPQNNDLIRWDAAQNKWVTWSMGSVVLTQAPMTGDEIRALTTMQDGWFVNCTADETSPPVGGTQFLAGNWYLYTVNPTAGWNQVGMTLDLSPYQTRIVGSTDVDKNKILTTNNDGKITSSTVAAGWLGRLAYVDVTSSIATALNGKVPRPSMPIPPGTKCKITYDANGLITGGANLSASDIPNIASNKINAMTGYAIGTSYSAIDTSDTLNQAIGKLEYLGKNPGATAKLTGYAIATTSQALTSSMTFNEAMGYIEYRLKQLEDANLVRYG